LDQIFLKTYNILPTPVKQVWDKVAQSTIGRRIAKGAFWSLFGSVISRGLMLLASIIVARILGKTEYGELGMIRSTVNMFAVFASFGLGLTATKYIAEFRERDKVKTGKITGLSTIFAGITGGIIAIIILISAPFLASKTINAPNLENELRLGAFMLFFSALNGAQTGILAGYEAFKTIAKVNLISGLIAFPIQIVFTYWWGLTGSVLGFGANFLVLWLMNYFAVRKESKKFDVKIDYRNSWSEWHVLYHFSLPALLSGLLVNPVLWACNALLVNQPNGYGEMAIFDAANQWRNLILFIPVALSQIVLPMLADTKDNSAQFNKILKLNVIINITISSAMAIVISLFSGLLMKSYGVGFANGKTALIILAFTTVFISFNNVIGQAIAGKGKMWVGLILNMIWAVFILLFAFIFIKKGLGATGIALALLLSYTVHTICQSTYFVKKLS